MSNELGKTALVLAGGGLTGAVYEIGALRAIDDLLVERTVNDFDIFVGTSAGSLVGSLLAAGISPVEMLQVIDGSHPDLEPLQRSHIFGVNYADWAKWGAHLPRKVLSAWLNYLVHLNDMTFFDLLWTLTEALPAGLYDGQALERFVRSSIAEKGGSNQFGKLAKELYIVATDLDTGGRVVFGKDQHADVPVSLAVAASSALPLVYKPVRIGEREYVDGSLRGNASLDVAIERGASLVVCINPMVPFKNMPVPDDEAAEDNRGKTPGRRKSQSFLSDKGIRLVADQTLRITGHSGLQYHIKQLRRRHPEVDIILIEPRETDSEIFSHNIMRFSARMNVARHGFESVTIDLASQYPMYKEVLARHGIPITRRLVIDELAELSQSRHDPRVVQRILEARSLGCPPGQMDTPLCQLNRSLAQLELLLDETDKERNVRQQEREKRKKLMPFSLE